MDTVKDVFVDAAGFLEVIGQNPENAFLLKECRGTESPENPFALLHFNESRLYLLKVRDDGKIVAAATIAPRKKGDQNWRPQGTDISGADSLSIGQVSAHRNHRGHGYGRDLLNSVFSLAAQHGVLLKMTSFEDDGKAHLAKHIPAIHAAHPQLQVQPSGHEKPMTFERPYSTAFMLDPYHAGP